MDNEVRVEKNDSGTHVHLDVTLTRDEYDRLILMLGMALGAATRETMTELSYAFLRLTSNLTNKLMEDNPDWIPYWVPEEGPKVDEKLLRLVNG